MDNHPIPQDVTHFQFKLIGEMTVKQFAYLAAGAVIAWITFALPIYFLIKFPLMLLFAGTGALFAFIPIEGRPTDLMLSYFMRAIFTPNQYVFQRDVSKPYISTYQPPISAVPNTKNTMPSVQPQVSPIQPFTLPTPTRPMFVTTPIDDQGNTHPPQMSQQKREEELQKKTDQLNEALRQTNLEEQKERDTLLSQQQNIDAAAVQAQLNQTLAQKEALEKELHLLKQQISQPQIIPTPTPIPAPPLAPNAIPHTYPAKIVKSAAEIGLPTMPDFPNLIMGVVKDARGNVLPNILIEVKDTSGNPVRAFKTNPLGQFASATPLLNGSYTVIFEDSAKKHTFQPIEITTDGTIMQPVEIISVDGREELRKELFG